MPLDEKIRRRLETSARLVERRLLRIERLLAGAAGEEEFRTIEGALPEARRAALREQAEAFRRALAAFGERLALRPQQAELRRLLEAELSSIWVSLENCYPQRMKGYGVAFDAKTRATLDREIAALLERVRAMRARLR
jgi:hypothetical protein